MAAAGNIKSITIRNQRGGVFAEVEAAREEAERQAHEARQAAEEARRAAEEAKAKAEGKPVPPRPQPPAPPPPPPPPANLDVAGIVRREKANTPEAAVKVRTSNGNMSTALGRTIIS